MKLYTAKTVFLHLIIQQSEWGGTIKGTKKASNANLSHLGVLSLSWQHLYFTMLFALPSPSLITPIMMPMWEWFCYILVPWNMLCPQFSPKDFTRKTNLIWFARYHMHIKLCVNMISGACPAFSLTTSLSPPKHLQAKICLIKKLSICAWSRTIFVLSTTVEQH